MGQCKWKGRRSNQRQSTSKGYKDVRSFKKRKLSNYSKKQKYHFAMEAVCTNNVRMFKLIHQSGLETYQTFDMFGSISEFYPMSEEVRTYHEVKRISEHNSIQKAAMLMDNYEMLEYMVRTRFLRFWHSYREYPRILRMLLHFNKFNAVHALLAHYHVDKQLTLCMPTLLSIAASSGKKEFVKYLIDRGANVNGHPWEDEDEGYIRFALFSTTEDMNGVYPSIMYSEILSIEEKINMMDFMYELGADPEGFTFYLPPPYKEAAVISPVLLDWFVQKGVDIAPGGNGPHDRAIYSNNYKVLQYLVDKGISITTPISDSLSPIEYAVSLYHRECFEILISQEESVDPNKYLEMVHEFDTREYNKEDNHWQRGVIMEFIQYLLHIGASPEYLEVLNDQKKEELSTKKEMEINTNDNEPRMFVIH